ncbi:hypothetical protein AC578_3549 [Pseudocercospora eumusae]|uniref:Uncharacterized protein n=1 Tax=Pseudocercospora eumusae TaxID=321146 RepID=A0A139GZI9_9PEZI|nr:hypothetical protein AC578_3549 [Pseudocercospora eumusae]KXS95625.1 hypothetical protein AC578_3549 [Pseudocercospora eumusae]
MAQHPTFSYNSSRHTTRFQYLSRLNCPTAYSKKTTIMANLLQYANTYHAYIFGTSFWYFLRGITRVIDPSTVCDWFRPPIDMPKEANDLELYTTRTDAFCLLSLSAILLVISDAMPLPKGLSGSQLSEPGSNKKPYARAIVLITILHHVATGIGAYGHWIRPSHHTVAMDIGVYGNVFLSVLGVVALVYGFGKEEDGGVELRSGKKVS